MRHRQGFVLAAAYCDGHWRVDPALAPIDMSTPDVAFPGGWDLRDDGDTLDVFDGAGDTVVCVTEASLATMLDHLGRRWRSDSDRMHTMRETSLP